MYYAPFISLKELAARLNRGPSSVRKYALKNGFVPIKRVTRDSRNQETLVFTHEQVKQIIALRDKMGCEK